MNYVPIACSEKFFPQPKNDSSEKKLRGLKLFLAQKFELGGKNSNKSVRTGGQRESPVDSTEKDRQRQGQLFEARIESLVIDKNDKMAPISRQLFRHELFTRQHRDSDSKKVDHRIVFTTQLAEVLQERLLHQTQLRTKNVASFF